MPFATEDCAMFNRCKIVNNKWKHFILISIDVKQWHCICVCNLHSDMHYYRVFEATNELHRCKVVFNLKNTIFSNIFIWVFILLQLNLIVAKNINFILSEIASLLRLTSTIGINLEMESYNVNDDVVFFSNHLRFNWKQVFCVIYSEIIPFKFSI